MTDLLNTLLAADIPAQVKTALREDVGSGDITAQLISSETKGKAQVITREVAVICGQAWVTEVFKQVDSQLNLTWKIKEGATANKNQVLFEIEGSLRHILTAERTALNFLQLLSGTATTCAHYASLVEGFPTRLLDTRKTIPGLRSAQKYAVTQGQCFNHRIGLFDAYLIKENHIIACGGILAAVNTAKEQHPGKPVEVEVETLEEFQQALDAGANIIMLDNFSLTDMRQAVDKNKLFNQQQTKLEASGGITEQTLSSIAKTGVDYISIGGLTKHCRAIDLSLRIL